MDEVAPLSLQFTAAHSLARPIDPDLCMRSFDLAMQAIRDAVHSTDLDVKAIDVAV